MKRITSICILTLCVMLFASLWTGCASIAPQITQMDKDNHKAIVEIARTRMESISCDVGLMDGLGFTSEIDFPIINAGQVRALLQNPGIGIAFVEIRDVAKKTKKPESEEMYWDETEYSICKVLGLEYRAAALSLIDILKIFPQLSPYLTLFGP
jgi:hypothetical protein